MKRFLLFSVFILGFYFNGLGQDLVKPEVLFFRIPDLARPITKAAAKNEKRELTKLKNTASAMRHAIIKDFRMNFNFCTIYFFNEGDLDNFKSGKWNQVTFWDKENKVVELAIDKEYYVINYGIRPPVYERSVTGKDYVSNNVQGSLEEGMVLRDKEINPIQGKLMFTPATLKKRGLGFLKPNSLDYVFYGAYKLELKLNKAFIADMIAPQQEK